jgi:hypothetical protein
MPAAMRVWLAGCVLLGACSFPVHRAGGGLAPRHDPGVVKLLVLPASADDVYGPKLQATMLSALQQDPHVRVEQADKDDWTSACQYAAEHGIDHIVQLRVRAGTDQAYSCRDSLRDILTGDHKNPHSSCGLSGPPLSRADIDVRFFQSDHCGRESPLSKHFWQGNAVATSDVQPLLAKRAAEATAWMQTTLPHYFTAEVQVVATADDHATVPAGAGDGVRTGDAFELYDAGLPAGYARATRVTATTTEVTPMYGDTSLDVGQLAVHRGRPWLIEIDPMVGASTMHVGGVTDRAFVIGGHARFHPFESGPIAGVGVEGQLASAQPTVVLGPELGWRLQPAPRLAVHAVAGVRLVNAELDHDTVVGAAADTVVGAAYTSRYGFVSVEGGYQWSTSMATASRSADLDGPLVRATFGIALSN